MTPRVVPESSLTTNEDVAIRAALCLCFPADEAVFSQTRAWHGTSPTWSVLVNGDNCIVAHVGVVEREILVGAERIRVAGIQNVLVLPDYRKTTLFRQVMSTAMEEAERRELDIGMLFCTRDLARVYAGLGWRLWKAGQVLRVDEHGLFQPLPDYNLMMFYPLRRRDVPAGDIHLLGNDW